MARFMLNFTVIILCAAQLYSEYTCHHLLRNSASCSVSDVMQFAQNITELPWNSSQSVRQTGLHTSICSYNFNACCFIMSHLLLDKYGHAKDHFTQNHSLASSAKTSLSAFLKLGLFKTCCIQITVLFSTLLCNISMHSLVLAASRVLGFLSFFLQ